MSLHTIVDVIPTPRPSWDVLAFDSYLYFIASTTDIDTPTGLYKVDLTTKAVSAEISQYVTAPLAMIDFGRPLDSPETIGHGAPDRRIYAPWGAGDLVEITPAFRDSVAVRTLLRDQYMPDIVASPQLRVVYFADPFSQRVGVYDPDEAAVVRYVPIDGDGGGVEALALSPDGRHLYAGPAARSGIAVFDTTEAAPRVTTRYPLTSAGTRGMTVTPDGRRLLVWRPWTAQLIAIDLKTGRKPEAQLGTEPTDVVVNDASTRAYVSSRRGGTVSVVDLVPEEPRTIATITGFTEPEGLCLSEDNTLLYVSGAGRIAAGQYGIRVAAV
jgi:DNA-binding beta-propeller fold protein YncE